MSLTCWMINLVLNYEDYLICEMKRGVFLILCDFFKKKLVVFKNMRTFAPQIRLKAMPRWRNR